MDSIADRIARVQDRIAGAAQRAGRDTASVLLLAVTKTVPVEMIQEAYDAGLRDFGENYYQEARDKVDRFGPDVRWHFIGHLQSNKARYIAGAFRLIHSVDTQRLCAEIGRRAEARGAVQDVLIEVRIDPAETKHGAQPDALADLVETAQTTPGLRLRGLMGMPPIGARPEDSRPYFAMLRRLHDALPRDCRGVLSMGMTGDFEVAIEEGSTIVRVGTAIFGPRA